jgi:hypothetical protein
MVRSSAVVSPRSGETLQGLFVMGILANRVGLAVLARGKRSGIIVREIAEPHSRVDVTLGQLLLQVHQIPVITQRAGTTSVYRRHKEGL